MGRRERYAEQAIHTTPKRLRILGDDEIEALYGRPHFSDDERLEYFALSPTERPRSNSFTRSSPGYISFYSLAISNHTRLITNCIIYYNAMLLSTVLAYKEGVGDAQGAVLLKQISPVAWQHINLYGRYEFRKSPDIIDFDAIVAELSRVPLSSTLAV